MARQESLSSSGLKIIVYNKQFVAISETFIYRQVLALKRSFDIELLGYVLINLEYFNLKDITFNKVKISVGILERVVKYLLRHIFGLHFTYPWRILLSLHRHLGGDNIIVHAHYGQNGLYLLPFLKRNKIPMVVSFHGHDASARLNVPKYCRALPDLFEYSSRIVLCSDHMIEKLGLDRYLHKVSVIPYGIDVKEFRPLPYTRQEGLIRILHSGRLVPKKGVMDLIMVFNELRQKYPRIELQIVGDGKERLACTNLTEELNIIDCVTFFGALPQSNVKELMNACDIFVLNSRTDENGDMEGLPNSILEAMAFEKPVVATKHAGIPMAIRNRETGLLISECKNEELFAALEELIINEQLRLYLGKNARTEIVMKFTDTIMADLLVSTFQQLEPELRFRQ